ncbi:MAG: response regulator [Lachnospiraceae bacterium]|nr:response regulator [Lachnospiraceae bacterium]
MKMMIQKLGKAAGTNAIFILVCILLVTELLSINWYFQAVCVVLIILCIIILAFQKSRVYSLWDISEVNQRQRDEMLMYFSREYFEVYVVDLDQGSYEIIRSSERHGDYIKNLTGDFAQLMEMALISWTKPPYRERFQQLLDTEALKRRFESGDKKIEFIYKSYDEKWKKLECFPVPDYGDNNEKMIFALRDYTAEMQIRTNEVLAAEAMNDIYTLVAFRDIEADRYECGYHRLENVLDFPDKGIYSDWVKLILGCIHEDDREKFLTELSDERFHREGRAECEYRICDKEGEYHYYRQYNAKVNVVSGPKMVILIRNIDEFKKHEIWKAEQLQKELEAKAKELEMTRLLAEKSKDLEKALQQAESANNAKSKFLSTMSHDLRTPMNVILGMAYMARKHIDDEEEVDRCLNTILLSSQNMLALINDVLDMNKIESGVIEVRDKKEDLVKLIGDIELLIRNRCEENQQILVIDCDRIDHRYVWMDKLRVRQIIINLLSNAVKYTPAYGRISMEVIEQPGRREKQCTVIFIIRDNGIGMSSDFVERVFDPFERENTDLSDRIEGTGLGMAITKNLVDLMQGHIKIDSMVNVGTKITVALPFMVCDGEDEGSESAITAARGKYPGKRILIVEDKHINMEIVKGFLEDTGLIIDEAANGREAVDMIRESAEGTYDLVFMDISMPVMRGDEAAMEIRKIDRKDCRELPVIAMTANALESDVRNSYKCGMNGHISKPIEPEEVYKCLNKWLMGGQAQS